MLTIRRMKRTILKRAQREQEPQGSCHKKKILTILTILHKTPQATTRRRKKKGRRKTILTVLHRKTKQLVYCKAKKILKIRRMKEQQQAICRKMMRTNGLRQPERPERTARRKS